MKDKLIIAVALAATALTSATALAGKATDTLNWSTTREIDVALPYYNNVREMEFCSVIHGTTYSTVTPRHMNTSLC